MEKSISELIATISSGIKTELNFETIKALITRYRQESENMTAEYIWGVVESNILVADIRYVKMLFGKMDVKPVIEATLQVIITRALFFPVANNKNLGEAYKIYLTIVKYADLLCLTRKEFMELYRAINLFNSDFTTKEKSDGIKENKELLDVVKILNNDLKMPKEKQWQLICGLVRGETIADVALRFPKERLSSLNGKEYRKMLTQLKRLIIKQDLLDILCVIEIGKRSDEGGGSFIENDLLIETNIVHALFRNNELMPSANNEKKKIIVAGSSLHYIRHWLKDETVVDYEVTFVIDTDVKKELLLFYIQNPAHAGNIKNVIYFVDIEFLEENYTEMCNPKITNLILMQHNMKPRTKRVITNLVNKKRLLCNKAVCIGADEDFIAAIHDLESNIPTAIILPRGLIMSRPPKNKTVWVINFLNEQKDVELIAAGLSNERGKPQVIGIPKESLVIPTAQLAYCGMSLREFVRSYKHNLNVKRIRQSSGCVMFSPEIAVHYNLSSNRLQAYCYELRLSEDGSTICTKKEKKIKGSQCNFSNVSEENVELFLKTKYPYNFVNTREGKVYIQKAISEWYRYFYETTTLENNLGLINELSLRTFWYVYGFVIDNKMNLNEKKLLKEIALSKIGDLDIVSAEVSDYIEHIEESFSGEKDRKYALAIIARLLKYAKAQGFINENVVENALKDDNFQQKIIREIRRTLTKKSLNLVEMRELTRLICAKIDDGQIEYIACLIELYTGLPKNIVCGLQWDDYHNVRQYGFAQLIVYRKLSSSETEYEKLSSLRSNRIIPCFSILETYLRKLYSRAKKRAEDSELGYIVQCNESFGNRSVLPVFKLAQMDRELIQLLGIQEELINIPTPGGGIIETDLSEYGGSIFSSNIEYWLHRVGADNDEIDYLLGRKASTTMGISYTDYTNPGTQLVMHDKLNRLLAMLEGTAQPISEITGIGAGKLVVSAKGDSPLRLKVEIATVKNETIKMKLKCKHGMRIRVGRRGE